MTDVAARAGVSLKTVSRVVNNVPSVDVELATRVRAAAADLNFIPNSLASSLRSSVRTSTIGLLIKDVENEFYATIISAVSEVATSRGWQLIVSNSGENPADEMEAILELCRRRVDGLLVVPTGGDHAALQVEIDRGIPVVFLDREPKNLAADAVLIDDIEGARRGITRLIEQGHTRIVALVDTVMMSTMVRRVQGMRAAFTDAGLDANLLDVIYDIARPEQARAEVLKALARQDPPTAFMCGNNRSGVGALTALWELRRPESLVMFDDFYLSQLMPMPFTVVTYDIRAIGRVGAELLFRRIDGERFAPQTVVLPTRLINRGIG
jgi:LacI family transcriptional regulator